MTGRYRTRVARLLALAGSLAISTMAYAQQGVTSPQLVSAAGPAAFLAESASPFPVAPVSAEDVAKIAMPKLAFAPTGLEAKDFDKYYYFYRADTDFATAYTDIAECDGYARGLVSGFGNAQVPYPYAGTMAGAAGGVIGNLMVDAIFGSAERRRMRRINMRQCMNFKGYERHGLAKAVWDEFNFDEGIGSVSASDRMRYLQQQALVAATAKPETKELGL